jgi:uncharacterized protein YdeI (YjbR/CyaY-like superfamily)
MEPTFFATPAEFRAWLEANHETEAELLVGFHKTNSGRPSITWPESVEQALCFGWIDGVRRRIDDTSYSIRFTPRKPRSNWSLTNVAKVEELTKRGLMKPAGLAAFARRSENTTGIYSFERKEEAELPAAYERRLRADRDAATWFEAQPPWYRRTAKHWVISAKREQTRERRMAQLIECCAAGRTVPPLTRPAGENRSP